MHEAVLSKDACDLGSKSPHGKVFNGRRDAMEAG